MKLSTIEFSGYKRLDTTSRIVDGHVVAFIRPNKSGKNTVLRGLRWLTDEGVIGDRRPPRQKPRAGAQ